MAIGIETEIDKSAVIKHASKDVCHARRVGTQDIHIADCREDIVLTNFPVGNLGIGHAGGYWMRPAKIGQAIVVVQLREPVQVSAIGHS